MRNRKPSHFDTCQDLDCERRWCVDRRNAACNGPGDDCEVENASRSRGRCKWCHSLFVCSGYGTCELHGDHGP